MKKILFVVIIAISFLGCNPKTKINKIKLDYLYYRALISDSISDYNSSIQYYNQMLNIDSINVNALINRGKALIHISKIQEGFKDLNKAIKYYPNADIYYARYTAYLFLNNYDSAEIDLNKVKEYNTRFPDYYYKLSSLKILKGDYFHALVYCDLGDELGLNITLSNDIKKELSIKLDKDIVANFNSDNILKIIKDIPIIKKSNNKMVKLDSLISGTYIISAETWDTITKQYTFKMSPNFFRLLE